VGPLERPIFPLTENRSL